MLDDVRYGMDFFIVICTLWNLSVLSAGYSKSIVH